ncbi:hypothetical protein AVEN_36446-1 [Araneus ventricosus]|uniref:Uncharacterized protein n=1 Tax=Araneus ventricosus TaxID=182803 RepID=A0A4Y2J6Q8_ARAVE|nr:hypothetical protein AVEN_36446-1 [Araneus ventricosus]
MNKLLKNGSPISKHTENPPFLVINNSLVVIGFDSRERETVGRPTDLSEEDYEVWINEDANFKRAEKTTEEAIFHVWMNRRDDGTEHKDRVPTKVLLPYRNLRTETTNARNLVSRYSKVIMRYTRLYPLEVSSPNDGDLRKLIEDPTIGEKSECNISSDPSSLVPDSVKELSPTSAPQRVSRYGRTLRVPRRLDL